MKILSVITVCPYCGGSAALLDEARTISTKEVDEQFVGKEIVCHHHGCNETFVVRRGDLKIRRDRAK